MISKLRFSLIAVILLVLLGFGLQDQAKGVPGENGQFCPFVEVPTGWLKTQDITPLTPVNFTGALIGTVEGINGQAFGGMDWQHVDFTNIDQPTPTNETGSQLVTWWSQKNGRTTFLQVTNADFDTWVHVRILDEGCDEIRNFCDFYTEGDTHVYDFSDLFLNDGDTPDEGVLQGREGFLTVTAVDECPSPDQAIEHNGLAGTVQVVDDIGYSYGFNTYHRWAVCFDQEITVFENRILNGSFQNQDSNWSETQGSAEIVTAGSLEPNIAPPSCSALNPQNPDCEDPDADLFQALVFSDNSVLSGVYSNTTNIFGIPPIPDFISSGVNDTNVSVLTSDIFTPTQYNQVLYNLQFLAPNDVLFTCDNYAAVCLVDVTDFGPPLFTPATLVDCDCYNSTGNGGNTSVFNFNGCTELGNNNTTYAFDGLEFQGGASTLQSGALSGTSSGRQYVVQTIVGQKVNDGCFSPIFPRATTGALVDNFQYIETFEDFIECDGILTGEFNAFLTDFHPTVLAGQFNIVGDDGVGGDAIIINFADQYQPDYETLAAFINADVGIIDEFEDFQSCGELDVCFIRLGIDADIPNSDEFESPTPTGTTPPPPTTTPPVTPTPTPTNTGGGGGGSCAIAGSPVQLGTAFANVLIPLVPVAFAFGVRAARRRKK